MWLSSWQARMRRRAVPAPAAEIFRPGRLTRPSRCGMIVVNAAPAPQGGWAAAALAELKRSTPAGRAASIAPGAAWTAPALTVGGLPRKLHAPPPGAAGPCPGSRRLARRTPQQAITTSISAATS
ncbi:hypothetical protein ACTMU2_31330 [Cupriavidus basilensis]